jgi:hypothetical protein
MLDSPGTTRHRSNRSERSPRKKQSVRVTVSNLRHTDVRREGTMGERNRKTASDASFRDEIVARLAWLAERDPMKAARLLGAFLDDLAEEAAEKGVRTVTP